MVKEEVFSLELTSGELLNFRTQALNNFIQPLVDKIENGTHEILKPMFPALCPVHEAAYDFIMRARGIEEHRVSRLTREIVIKKPILVALDCPNGAVDKSIIDGHHRYVWAWRNKLPLVIGIMIPREVWINYLVGIPHAKLPEKSGL